MASPFDRIIGVASATHDRVMAETFEFRPQKYQTDRNAPRVDDPDRPVTSGVLATFGDGAARAGGGPFAQVGVVPARADHSTSRPFISLDLARLPYRPMQGDLVWRDKTSTLYRIFEVLPSVPGYVRISLNIGA